MLKFKLVPVGKRHQLHYRICVAQENTKLTGPVIEILGHYHPHQQHTLYLNEDRIKYWQGLGVQSTTKIRKLFSHGKISLLSH